MQLLRENPQGHGPPLVRHEHLIVDSAADRDRIRTEYLSF